MTYEEKLSQFEQRTMLVKDILDFHPDMHPDQDSNFTKAECDIFKKFFLVDWDAYDDDYKIAFARLYANEEEAGNAEEAYNKFIVIHRIG